MKETEAGFTLMEALLTVAIVLVISGILVAASGAAVQGASKSIKALTTAATLTRIDRYIRTKADALHIPYWADPAPYVSGFSGELYQSKIGPYITSVKTITNDRNVVRGIEVEYTAGGREMRTVALLPSIPILDMEQ